MWLHALWLGQIMCTLHDFMQGGHTLSYIVGSLSGCGIYVVQECLRNGCMVKVLVLKAH